MEAAVRSVLTRQYRPGRGRPEASDGDGEHGGGARRGSSRSSRSSGLAIVGEKGRSCTAGWHRRSNCEEQGRGEDRAGCGRSLGSRWPDQEEGQRRRIESERTLSRRSRVAARKGRREVVVAYRGRSENMGRRRAARSRTSGSATAGSRQGWSCEPRSWRWHRIGGDRPGVEKRGEAEAA